MPAYLVLPILTLVTQLLVQKMSSPPTTDPQQAAMNQMMYFFPFMLFFFALQVPSGLSLYWVVMNLFTLVQQYIFMQGWKKPIIAGRKTHGERTKKP
jgi:YidC/Oxa1 family membrane protein insertase